MGSLLSRKKLLVGGAVISLVVVGVAVPFAMSLWGDVNRVSIDRPNEPAEPAEVASEDVVQTPSQAQAGDVGDEESGPAQTDEGVEVFLLVGSDSRDDLESFEGFGAFGGHRADVVMVLLRTGSEAAVLSLPRDLWVESPCFSGESRLNQMLEGCGDDLNGPTALTVAVEELIGEQVDHFAMVDLAGFQAAVDAVGGYEICVENPVRDQRAKLDLPAGCTLASGEQSLAWLRSRHTRELTAEGWRVMPGVSDLARNERQRVFLIDMMGRLADFSSPQAMASAAQAVAPFLTVDADLSLFDAVDLAWTMRGLGDGSIRQLEVPVLDHVTDDGAAVLLPATPVDVVVAGFLAPEMAGQSGQPQAMG